MGLPGPSKTIRVEPVRTPATQPAPSTAPAPSPKKDPVPA